MDEAVDPDNERAAAGRQRGAAGGELATDQARCRQRKSDDEAPAAVGQAFRLPFRASCEMDHFRGYPQIPSFQQLLSK